MAIDGFFIKNLIIETKEELINSRLEQINLVSKDIFSFSFYLKGSRKFLNIKLNSPFASFFIGDIDIDKNLNSNYLSNLKRLLEGAILKDICQYSLDRVVIFTFSKNDFLDGIIEYQLILELMGRYNNLTLVKDELIVDAFFKNISTSNRSIVPNIKFEFFPSSKELFVGADLSDPTDNLFYSKKYLGVSPLLSKYLFNNKKDLDKIKVVPTYNLTTKEFYWFNLFNSDNDLKHYHSLSSLIATLVFNNYKPNNKYIDFINNRINNYNKRLFKLERQLETSISNLVNADYGNYIYSSGLNLNSYLNEITSYDNTLVKLDISKTLNENARAYFKLYDKAKRSLSHIEEQILATTNLLDIFNQFLFEVNLDNLNYEEIESMLIPFGFKVKRKKQFKPKKINPLKLVLDETIFYIGLNNLQNEYVTNTLGKHNDYWFHVKDLPGSHVLLKGELTNVNLKICAMLALKYSKGSLTTGEVNYTLVKNLRKIPGLPGYNVTLKNYESVLITIDENILKPIFEINNVSY